MIFKNFPPAVAARWCCEQRFGHRCICPSPFYNSWACGVHGLQMYVSLKADGISDESILEVIGTWPASMGRTYSAQAPLPLPCL